MVRSLPLCLLLILGIVALSGCPAGISVELNDPPDAGESDGGPVRGDGDGDGDEEADGGACTDGACSTDGGPVRGDGDGDGDGDPDPVCGNDAIELGELCDGDDLGGQTCTDVGPFVGGELTCSVDCLEFEIDGCTPGDHCLASLTLTAHDGTAAGEVRFHYSDDGELRFAKRTNSAGGAAGHARYVEENDALVRIDLTHGDGTAAGHVAVTQLLTGGTRAHRYADDGRRVGTIDTSTGANGTKAAAIGPTGMLTTATLATEVGDGRLTRLLWRSATGAPSGWAFARYRVGLCERPPVFVVP